MTQTLILELTEKEAEQIEYLVSFGFYELTNSQASEFELTFKRVQSALKEFISSTEGDQS